ncbi:hypothetical protein YpF1991016_2825 [Yersinia pestis biovar Orientalis str. F1991016]|nr:hypothetical protein YpF1991016_2825 [Yersinia pestis biovar Orientalis str. F1991016]CHL32001.1 Uncharacterised protein [Salmonella enterica subsp. enterica serovar Typhi]
MVNGDPRIGSNQQNTGLHIGWHVVTENVSADCTDLRLLHQARKCFNKHINLS